MTAPQQVTWPAALTEDLRTILGMMCFQLGPIAHGYQAAGEFVGVEGLELKKRAEDEQAFMLHKLIAIWIEHGDGWRAVAADELERIAAKAKVRAS